MQNVPLKGRQRFADLGFPAAGFATATNSSVIDQRSYNYDRESAAIVVLVDDTTTATNLALKIQHSDTNGNFVDVTPGEHSPLVFAKTFPTVDPGIHEMHISLNYLKRFWRVVATPQADFDGRIVVQYYNARKEIPVV